MSGEPWTILSLFDWSGNWSRPYREAGYPVMQFDLLHGTDLRTFDFTRIPRGSVRGILAAVPCTDFSRAGAQYWPAKDADGRTAKSIELANRIMDLIEYHAPFGGAWRTRKAELVNWCRELGYSASHPSNPRTSATLIPSAPCCSGGSRRISSPRRCGNTNGKPQAGIMPLMPTMRAYIRASRASCAVPSPPWASPVPFSKPTHERYIKAITPWPWWLEPCPSNQRQKPFFPHVLRWFNPA